MLTDEVSERRGETGEQYYEHVFKNILNWCYLSTVKTAFGEYVNAV